MTREKMFDPAFQKAFTEAILKENKVRLNWNIQHGSLLKQAAEPCTWDDEPDDDDDDMQLPLDVEKEDKFFQQNKVSPPKLKSKEISYKKQLPSPKLKSKEISDEKQLPPVMKPVPSDVKKLLDEGGTSKEREGRYQYLKKRYEEDPEEKFYYPLLSSWQHGWTYGEDTHLKCPDHGRKQIIKASFFRRNDPQLKPRD